MSNIDLRYYEIHASVEAQMRQWEEQREPYVSPYGANKCVGLCTKTTEWGQYKCSNDLYMLLTKRYRLINEVCYIRKVLSIGIVIRRYGRSFDIPLTRWRPEAK